MTTLIIQLTERIQAGGLQFPRLVGSVMLLWSVQKLLPVLAMTPSSGRKRLDY
jgi:hypothetical protein